MRGFLEVLSALVLLAIIILKGQPSSDEVLPVLVFGIAALAVRIAIAMEYLRCTEHGIAWRSLFAAHALRWDQVTSVETEIKAYSSSPLKRRHGGEFCLVVRGTDGRAHPVLASVWCPLPRHAEFLIAAQDLCPHDLHAAEAEAPTRRASGKRVGRPTGRRRSNG
jgi:hypothetical protein